MRYEVFLDARAAARQIDSGVYGCVSVCVGWPYCEGAAEFVT